ncbi:RNA-directed DNA polymerase [Nostoc sp. LEGE 06077]|uniref:reverse transcriptase domain-containing protein n=1 Tax=Nostoc sp. LEGE 06077 TaxID=915325 RepID=UPI00187F01BA|nr:reverse transcriptase domain-containing protein [Nostoc sp. LEGE 06077]MBE9207236.1 RNA-directed DNA polymerase [Nostoc sp. LEGE 06077]
MKDSSKLILTDQPESLREQFYSLKQPSDLADLLNVSYSRLVYHIYVVDPNQRYKTFEISKKSGGVRQISTPVTALKIIQRKLNQVLQAVYEIKPSVHGFVKGKNIVTNAQSHAKKRYVFNIDLKDFFPSINFGRVRGMFMTTPYGLHPEVATVLAQICCHNNQLPQGAPTSPIITNMICAKMDSQLQRLAKDCKATYTRYADDITFSTTLPKFPRDLAYIVNDEDREELIVGNTLLNIISDNGFELNEEKVRLQVKGNHQEVTGLTTNIFPNVDRNYVRQVRAMLHAWAKFGLEAAENEYQEKYECQSKFTMKGKTIFKQVLLGKIEFIGMVKGKENVLYKKCIEQYKILSKFSS